MNRIKKAVGQPRGDGFTGLTHFRRRIEANAKPFLWFQKVHILCHLIRVHLEIEDVLLLCIKGAF